MPRQGGSKIWIFMIRVVRWSIYDKDPHSQGWKLWLDASEATSVSAASAALRDLQFLYFSKCRRQALLEKPYEASTPAGGSGDVPSADAATASDGSGDPKRMDAARNLATEVLFFNAFHASESRLTGLLVCRDVTRQAVRAGWGWRHGGSFELVDLTESMVDVRVAAGGGRCGGGGMASGGGGAGRGRAWGQTGEATSSPPCRSRLLPRQGMGRFAHYGPVKISG